MADNSNKTFDEDSWNDSSNYDRIQDLLRNIDSINEKTKVTIGGPKNHQKQKFVSQSSSRFQKSRKVRSKSISTGVSINHTINTMSNNEWNSIIRKENENL